MPRTRGKANKSCQTDTVYLTEDQVEKIVTKSLSTLNNELQRLQNEITDLKSTTDKLTNGSDSDAIHQLSNELTDLKATSEKLIKDSDALNNLQQSTDIQIEQFQENLDLFEEKTVAQSKHFIAKLMPRKNTSIIYARRLMSWNNVIK